MQLRPYQEAPITDTMQYLQDCEGDGLVVMPVGSGKSVVIGELTRRMCATWPNSRIIMLTHQRELIAQNFQRLLNVWPDAPAGIYSAGLGKRDLRSQIIFAGIQSIYSKAHQLQTSLGAPDIALIDEAHLISVNGATRYQRFLCDLRQIKPWFRLIGFTATAFRLDSGSMIEGRGALFNDVIHELPIIKLIEDGFLTSLTSRPAQAQIDLTGIGKGSDGDYLEAAMTRAAERITDAAVDEIVQCGQRRQAWLLFCSGVDHAYHVRDAMRSRGISAETITGDTPKAERDAILAAFRRGQIRCLTNNAVLTTGVDVPRIDLIAALRGTKSAGLWVQMVGRGTRLIDAAIGNLPTREARLAAIAASPKPDCLVLDFGGNIAAHGPIDQIKGVIKGARGVGISGPEEAPTKSCPNCEIRSPAAARMCAGCGYEFPPPDAAIDATAAMLPVLSSQVAPPVWVDVERVSYHLHSKPGKPDSLRVDYRSGLVKHSEWVCLEHSGAARGEANKWWRARTNNGPVPGRVRDALAIASAIATPSRIQVRPDGKFMRVVGYDFSPLKGN